MNCKPLGAARTLRLALAASAVLLAPSARRLSPLALAAALALGSTPALPADITFYGHDTRWDTPTNWGGNVLPGPADNARLGNYDVDLYGSASVLSFSGTGALRIGGSLNIATASSIGRLYVNGGTLTAATNSAFVTANMDSYWSGGTIGGVNNTTVHAVFNGGLTFNGASGHQLLSSSMSLAGLSAWYDNAQITFNQSTLYNAGTFNDANTGNASLSSLHTADAINNNGLYLKTGSGTSTIGTAFFNGGSLAVNAGTLVLSRGVQFVDLSEGNGNSNGGVSVANGATLNLGANSSSGNFDLTSGTLTGAGTLTAGKASTWVAGALTGTGGTVFNDGLAISGSATKTIDQRSATLAGASSWSGNGGIVLNHGAVLTNNGSFNDQTAGVVSLEGYSGSAFINAGTYTKSGAGNTNVSATFSNSGTLAVNAGTLSLIRGISGSGSASVASGATLSLGSVGSASSLGRLNLNGGTLNNNAGLIVSSASTWTGGVMYGSGSSTFSGGLAISGTAVKSLSQSSLLAGTSSWSGNGNIAFSNGVVLTNSGSFADQNTGAAILGIYGTVGSFVNAGSYTKSGAGTTTINTAFANSGTLAVNAGALIFNGVGSGSGSASVASGATLSFAAASSIGSLNLSGGTLTGAGALTVSNASTWTGGTMSGTGSSTFSNGLAISGAGKALDQRGLILAGASSWSGNGNIAFYDGAVLTNNGSFADQNSGSVSLTSNSTSNRFVNAGTYTKSGAGTTFINTAFTNNGTLAVNAGSLYMNGVVSGSGSVNLTGGALSLGGGPSIGSLNLSGGALTWAGALSVSNASTWTRGTMSGYGSSGSSTFGGGLAISSGAAKTLDQRNLILAGASSWAGNGSIAFSNGAVLTNNGSFADQNTGAVSLTSSGTGNSFANAGTYTKSGAGATTINTAFSNNGTLAVNAGTLYMNGGGSGSGSVNLTGGTLSFGVASS
ncbi:beta strand repeat-containing protein, partial [Aquabacterium sp.]|uniref:beta strand repeat-containing protein n=1 Tax=Aquabacterium sp. TaxID=1872578 RepID=UPI002C4A7AF8|nr:hypothetical protein [Aquabacterium sp.]